MQNFLDQNTEIYRRDFFYALIIFSIFLHRFKKISALLFHPFLIDLRIKWAIKRANALNRNTKCFFRKN